MKAIKIILAVLLLVALLPASGCVASETFSAGSLRDELDTMPTTSLTFTEINLLPSIIEDLDSIHTSLSFLMIATFIFILSAGIIAIAWREKFYGALTAGILVLIPYVWNSIVQKSIRILLADSFAKRLCKSLGGSIGVANFLVLLPMVLLLLIGIVETLVYFLPAKEKPNNQKPSQAHPFPVDTESIPTPHNGDAQIDDIRKYKELLDSGVITQEEFDAKKKQLLGL